MTKEEVLFQIDSVKSEFISKTEVVSLINRMATSKNKSLGKPDVPKTGDLFLYLDRLGKRRPALVLNVEESYCVIVTLTSQSDSYRTLSTIKSRFLNNTESFLSNTIDLVGYSEVITNFIGVIDHLGTVNLIKKNLKENINRVLLK